MKLDEVIENCEKKREELEGIGLSDSLIQIIKFAYKEGTKERTKMTIKECKNAELDAKNKTSLYLDDFDSLEVWQSVCKSLNVPINADQIYFDAENITYC